MSTPATTTEVGTSGSGTTTSFKLGSGGAGGGTGGAGAAGGGTGGAGGGTAGAQSNPHYHLTGSRLGVGGGRGHYCCPTPVLGAAPLA
ncbi:hypothetical protein JX360_15680 [Synechococcus bigranulatus str. 'Rupite']|uniref:Uncharacterized protein n=1 Tax=Thermostichus vulcanus str. 'Rupite' TaxID=2813851 RepID=A0ABT0CEX4_THEVL|nr:hypothetical protein [Thermostichus vulcanus str. 'Rupite']